MSRARREGVMLHDLNARWSPNRLYEASNFFQVICLRASINVPHMTDKLAVIFTLYLSYVYLSPISFPTGSAVHFSRFFFHTTKCYFMTILARPKQIN